MDTADLSDSISPSSPLPNAGDDTEAGLDLFQAGHELADIDTADVQEQLQQESHYLQLDDNGFGDGSKRRKGNPNLRADPGSSTIDASYKPQLAFTAVVDSLAEACNGSFGSRNRFEDQIADAVMRMQRRDSFPMPWDNLPHRNVWKVPKPAENFKLPLVGRFDRPAFHPVQDMVENRQAAWLQDKPFAGKRLLASKLAQSDDALLSGALRKLRNIVLFHPGDSQLGRALVSKAGSLVSEDVLQRSPKDSISSKAVGTAVKRITDYHRFAQFLVSTCHKRPLCPDEADFYKYVCHLQASGAGATAGATLLQAWSFFRFTFGVDGEDQATLVSGRVRGVVNSMFATKRKLLQAPPIPADYVYRMELFLRTSSDSRLKTIVGFLLFCVYSCARFGDAAKGDPSALDFQESTSSDLTLIEIALSQYKTATGERKAILLPLIALGCGLDSFSWGMAWKEARRQSGADAMRFLMCADDHNGCTWLDRRMTTAEGSFWVKDVLVMLGMDVSQAASYSTHSLKATCLSWASKAGSLTLQERLWLGHHESEESKMAITYARDALVGALIKLRMIVEAIKGDLFDPDLSRADRIANATGLVVDPKTVAEKSQEEEDTERLLCREEFQRETRLLESDVEDADGVCSDPIPLPSDRIAHERGNFPNIDPACCVKHRISGIVHMVADVHKLSCGRSISINMLSVENGFGAPGQFEFCEQCRAVIGL